MSQTILLEPDENINQVLNLNLQTYIGTDVIQRDSAKDVIELLSILPTIDLIITKDSVESDETARQIYEYIQKNNLNIPMVILGNSIDNLPGVTIFPYPIKWEQVVQEAGQLLGISPEKIKFNVAPQYVAVPIVYFYGIKKSPCDIFIKIKKGANSFQYVKRLKENDNFEKNDIDRYKGQGLINFYIPYDYQQYFTTYVTNKIVESLQDETDINKKLTTSSNAFDVIQTHMDKFGITNDIVELASSNIK